MVIWVEIRGFSRSVDDIASWDNAGVVVGGSIELISNDIWISGVWLVVVKVGFRELLVLLYFVDCHDAASSEAEGHAYRASQGYIHHSRNHWVGKVLRFLSVHVSEVKGHWILFFRSMVLLSMVRRAAAVTVGVFLAFNERVSMVKVGG